MKAGQMSVYVKRGAAAVLLAVGVTSAMMGPRAGAQEEPLIASDDVAGELTEITFSDTQARRGEASYGASCARCHGATLDGADGPPLIGANFQQRWTGTSAADFLLRISATMPAEAPGSLSRQQYISIVAFIARENGAEAGEEALPDDDFVLSTLLFLPMESQ